MARLVPTIDTIDAFPKSLEPGERALMEALCAVLDDDWVIYVQPTLNGLQPDIIIFSEEAGMGILEVKDWALDRYEIQPDNTWLRDDGVEFRCPLAQVKSYKDSIYRYELAELEAEKILDKRVYRLAAPFVYFHCYTSAEARKRTSPVSDPYITVFGHDDLQPARLRALLSEQHLKKGSLFAEMMKRYELQNRLLNALDYADHGRLDVSDILFSLTKAQQKLLSNAPGRRRAIGVAGSGKTLLLVRKAVNAALDNRNVLIVCFNITMVNYLSDVVRRLSRFKSRGGIRLDEHILVRHYHRLYPQDTEHRKKDVAIVLEDEEVKARKPFDVILIDEGQDFKREWIERLFDLASEEAHSMFVEDDRQNIYGQDAKARGKIPGILGRPNELLQRSFRINSEVAALANRLVASRKDQFESGDVEIAPPLQGKLVESPKPTWFQGDAQSVMSNLADEIRRLIHESRSGAFADLVILVCTVEDGWAVCDRLDTMRLPFIGNFESRKEFHRLAELYEGEQLKEKREQIRRARKVAFRMQTGRIKVCTIHSFKGWELRRVLVHFHPAEEQTKQKISLLYTAMTRTLESLAVFNADPALFPFGRLAAQEGLVTFSEAAVEVEEAWPF